MQSTQCRTTRFDLRRRRRKIYPGANAVNEEEEEEEQGGSLANGAADLLSEIRYSSLSIISYLFGEGAVASSAPIPS